MHSRPAQTAQAATGRRIATLLFTIVLFAVLPSCGGSAPSPSESAKPSSTARSVSGPTEDPTEPEPTEEAEPPPPLATKFSDKKNTYAGVDGKNKTWEGGSDLKPGTYRTVDTFEPETTPPNTCRAWSSDPDSDDLDGESTLDKKYRAVLKVHDGDEVTSVGCGTWKRV